MRCLFDERKRINNEVNSKLDLHIVLLIVKIESGCKLQSEIITVAKPYDLRYSMLVTSNNCVPTIYEKALNVARRSGLFLWSVFYIGEIYAYANPIFVQIKLFSPVKKDLGHQNTMLNSAFASVLLNAYGLRNTQNTFPQY